MSSIEKIFFCLLFSINAFSQGRNHSLYDVAKAKKDSIYKSKYASVSKISLSLLVGGTIKSTFESRGYSPYLNPYDKYYLNEWFGTIGTYHFNPYIKINTGCVYHHFSYQNYNNDLLEFKMLFIPFHIAVGTNECRKVRISIGGGPDLGLTLFSETTLYGTSDKFRMGINNTPKIFGSIFISMDYALIKNYSIGITTWYYKQITPYRGQTGSAYCAGCYESYRFFLLYSAYSVEIKYKFNKRKKSGTPEVTKN